MKAIVYARYGPPDVLELRELDRPAPKANEVLIKVHAASLNPLDWHLMRGEPRFLRLMGFGLFKPKDGRLGADIAGRVESVGALPRRLLQCDSMVGVVDFLHACVEGALGHRGPGAVARFSGRTAGRSPQGYR